MQSLRPPQAEFPIGLVWLVSLALLVFGFFAATDDIVVWVVCALTLPVALTIAGGRRLLVAAGGSICFFWAAVFSDLLGKVVNPILALVPEATTTSAAMYLSLAALCVIALGYRCGVGRTRASEQRSPELDVKKLFLAYVVSLVVVSFLTIVATYIPVITQPVLAFQALKLICLYLLTAQIFRDGRGYGIVAFALLAEIISGLTGYIAHFQAPLFIIIAGAISGRKLQGSQWAGAFALMIVLFYVSVVWSGIKPDYRSWLAGPGASAGTSEKAYWIYNRIANEGLDYQDAFGRLTKRLGYTHMLSMTMTREDQGLVPPTAYYLDAIERVLTPRFLFPDKAAINDTAVTRVLTGQNFGEGTSVSVGYLAQAYADFGFPMLFAPIFLIGLLQGRVVRYFLNRPISLVARGAFASASVVTMFSYEFNIDKALGGFVLTLAALALLEFALYRKFEGSITRKSPVNPLLQTVSGRKARLHPG